MKKIKYGIFALSLMLISNISLAQDEAKIEAYAKSIVDKLKIEANLTDQQYDDMMEITFGYTKKIEEIKVDPVFNKTQKENEIKEYLTMREGVIKDVLSAEQYEKYKKIFEKVKL